MADVADLSVDTVLDGLRLEDIDSDDQLAESLLIEFGVWFPVEAYQRLPVFLPHVIRDASARSRGVRREAWGEPTSQGYFRDDNSLVKEAVKSLTFASPRPLYQGRRIGRSKGWVACHLWQIRRDGKRACESSLTNSFMGNLVWLPRPLARLSDL